MDSPLALLKSDSLNRRELTFKALAGLCGGAIGWLPVELASHNSHLGEVQTTWEMVAYYLSAAFAAGAIGAFITAVDTSEVRITPEAKRRFTRGFLICAGLSLVSTWLGNFVFNWVLQTGGVTFSTNGELVSGSVITLVIARLMGWAIDGALVGAGVGLATLTMENVPKGAVGGLVGGAVGGIGFDLIGCDRRRRAGFTILWRSGHRPCDRTVHWTGPRTDQGRVGHGRAGAAARAPVPNRGRARVDWAS